MSKFQEFDYIQTPEQWKELDLTNSFHKKTLRLSKFAIAVIVMISCFSSFGLIYAYNEDFQLWIQQQFQIKKTEPNVNIHPQKSYFIENSFMCEYHEVNNQKIVDQVYAFENGNFVKQDIQHMQGNYQSQNYAFDYVQHQDKILTFHEEGYILDTLSYFQHDIMYFNSQDANLCELNMKNQTVRKITHDNDSVNFSISPKGTYILINKNDKYWTVYNTITKEEKVLETLDPYAHNNTFAFLNDEQLITYNDEDLTCIINLRTHETKSYDVQCVYPEASSFVFTYEEHQTIIRNVLTNQYQTLDYNLSLYNYAVIHNRYIIFQLDKNMIIYDFENQKIKELNYPELSGNIYVYVFDDNYFMLSYAKDYYILSLKDIFG